MSADLYPNRLYWDGRSGCAKFGGEGVVLAAMPQIPGLPVFVTEIDYAPGVCGMLRERCEARRDMDADEIRAVRAWLAWKCWETPCDT